jgi:putative DNA primase/helicase
MSGNYRPKISGADEGIWRRVRLVPFGVTIPKEERDIHLADKLRAEGPGILNWLLDGLRVWCDNGLREPADVLEATAEYRSASDPVGRFLATCVVASPGDRVQSSLLHQVYEAWCKSSGENAWKQNPSATRWTKGLQEEAVQRDVLPRHQADQERERLRRSPRKSDQGQS